MTFNGEVDGSESSEGDTTSEQRALRAERGQMLAQTREEHDYASARLTFINGQEGEGIPDVRHSHAHAAAAALQETAN